MAPIKGVSDVPRLPRLGKLHLGIKVQQAGKPEYPRATDYFVCPPEVQAVYGAQPHHLDVVFPTDDPEQWASHFYRAYSSYRGLVCKGDGEKAVRLVDLDAAVAKITGEIPEDLHPRAWPVAHRESKTVGYREILCPPDSCPQYLARACKPVMNLQFCLPSVPGIGVWQLDTSSWNSIRNVLSGIRLVQALGGRISMIPLRLSLIQQEVQPEGIGKKNIHVLQLTAPYKLADLFHYIALPRGQAILPEPDLETPEDLFLPEAEGPGAGAPPPAPAATVDGFFAAPDRPTSSPTPSRRDLSSLRELKDLFYACWQDFQMQPDEVVRVAGYSRQQDLASLNLAEVYQQIQATR